MRQQYLNLLPALSADNLFGNTEMVVVCAVPMNGAARKTDFILA